MTAVVGIDGTKRGWVAAELVDGRLEVLHLLHSIETRFDELAHVDVIAIDVPIGFGPREADRAARQFLRGNSSTVFTTPSRQVLETEFAPGLGVSAQSHALGRRILHVTELAFADGRFFEVHPEVSFRMMNEGAPLHYRKKSAGGVFERIALLRRQGFELNDLGAAALAPIDDELDAIAAAWSAQRIANGDALSLPQPPEHIDGRPVAIWY